MAKPFSLSLNQMKEVRRGILLAKHDYQLLAFETKHQTVEQDEPLIQEMLEVYASTEKLIMGQAPLTDLTVEAYCRTMDKLRGDDPLPE